MKSEPNLDVVMWSAGFINLWAYSYFIHLLPSLPKEFVWWGIPTIFTMALGFFIAWMAIAVVILGLHRLVGKLLK